MNYIFLFLTTVITIAWSCLTFFLYDPSIQLYVKAFFFLELWEISSKIQMCGWIIRSSVSLGTRTTGPCWWTPPGSGSTTDTSPTCSPFTGLRRCCWGKYAPIESALICHSGSGKEKKGTINEFSVHKFNFF